MNRVLKYCIILHLVSLISAISTGANEPIADNELGLTAKDCALQYCNVKDGMALWLTLASRCVEKANPYFMEIKEYNDPPDINSFSKLSVGFFCAFMSSIGYYSGYLFGKLYPKSGYMRVRVKE